MHHFHFQKSAIWGAAISTPDCTLSQPSRLDLPLIFQNVERYAYDTGLVLLRLCFALLCL